MKRIRDRNLCRLANRRYSKTEKGKKTRQIWEEKNKEGIREYFKLYYIKNKERKKIHDKKYRLLHPERNKKYEHSEKARRLQKRKNALRRHRNPFDRRLVQMVYEDNIKKYGTLTCIYCLKPIQFGNDSLEHKIPLSKGGTHEYNNLAIACLKCNLSKGSKTMEEFLSRQKSDKTLNCR